MTSSGSFPRASFNLSRFDKGKNSDEFKSTKITLADLGNPVINQ
eukprot:CAMPEP_0179840392 /NCGR_PEP_ID=MMETSP0982-20121206/1903_1 /TAXON_ID=483367 /ORGANISM="non described non described, Strain CCMP 2436" /LENGTH=43 /DNA_ID= /DNA_START= /DNA_END= /DNA_ORIENTATION=